MPSDLIRAKWFLAGICLALLGCVDNSNKNQGTDNYVDKEIRDRVQRINAMNREKDTLLIDAAAVEKKVAELILLSKDIENLSASVNMGNAYFDDMRRLHHLNNTDIQKLNTGMHINDIATALKQNEMALFNHVLLQVSHDAVPLHAAQ